MPIEGVECTKEEAAAFREIMEGRRRIKKDLAEPMIPINHTGYGVKIKDVLTIAVFIFMGGGAYVAVTSQLTSLEHRLSIVPEDVQKSVLQSRVEVLAAVSDIKERQEANRVERLADIKELTNRVSKGEQERAALNQKVDNLEDLMRDVRELLRKVDASGTESKMQGHKG